MKCEIEVVGDDELAGRQRLIVERTSGPPLLIVTESAARTWAFLQRWEASQQKQAEVVELRPQRSSEPFPSDVPPASLNRAMGVLIALCALL